MAQSPLTDKKFRNLFAGCWLAWLLLQVQVLVWYRFPFRVAVIDSVVTNVLLAGCCILIASILRYYLPQRHRYSFLLGLCAIVTVLWFFCSRTMLLLALYAQPTYESFFAASVSLRIAIAFLMIGCMTLICVLWYGQENQQEAERRQRDAEQLSKDAELYKLRQQLQPHFLFNSLNSINALVSMNPALARTMIQQLSDFLRGTIKREENSWISLEEEFEQLRLYLDIEKVRFGHRLQTVIENKIAGDIYLPAMLLQPVVENAIKFGLYDTIDMVTICIKAEISNDALLVRISNPFDAATDTASSGTGFGLASLQRRLYLLFARNDLLQTATDGANFITTIKIPQRDKSPHH